MKKVLISLLCIISYANTSLQLSLVDYYRQNGITSLSEQIEAILQNPLYWKEFLKDKDVSMGFYELDTPIIAINKSKKTMKLYHSKKHKQNLSLTQDVIVGKMGDKQKEGDLKTPVGVYEIKRRFVPEDNFYGPLAFVLSYPNNFDKLKNKNGHGIWIHGFPESNKTRDDMTKGCIALKNDLLKKFDGKLATDKGVVIVSEKDKIGTDKEVIANILSELFKWRNAWKNSKIKKYLSFYDKNFVRFDGKKKKEFSKFKKIIFRKKENKTIIFKNISIVPYPDIKEKNLFRITFQEIYKTKKHNFQGKKELYVKMVKDKMKILTEK